MMTIAGGKADQHSWLNMEVVGKKLKTCEEMGGVKKQRGEFEEEGPKENKEKRSCRIEGRAGGRSG